MQASPQCIFLDFHGTISAYTFWSSLEPAKYARIQSFLFKKHAPTVRAWMCGEISTDEILALVSQGTGIRQSELIECLDCELNTCPVDNRIRKLVASIKEVCPLFLFSDNMDVIANAFRRDVICDDFRFAWFSSDHGRLKNGKGGRSYLDVARQFDLNIANCVLLDDSKSSILTFRDIGGSAYQTSGVSDTASWLGQVSQSEGMLQEMAV